MTDLWPDDIEHTSVKAPVTILREQGTLLGRKTSNLVEGEITVGSRSDIPSESFSYIFYFVAPALGGYRYRLLEILHSAVLYPLLITMDSDIFAELLADMGKAAATRTPYTMAANSEDSFMEILRKIFATKKVKRVIEAIIAQSG